jgi:hypothetical protein
MLWQLTIQISPDERQFNEEDVVINSITIMIDAMGLSIRNYTCSLSSPFSNVIVLIALIMGTMIRRLKVFTSSSNFKEGYLIHRNLIK